MSLNAGTVEVGFKGNPQEIEAAINRVEKRLATLEQRGQKVQSSFADASSASNKFAIGLAATSVAASLIAKSFIMAAGKLELYQMQFDTLLGSTEKGAKLMKELSDFALKTPFTITGIRDTATQLLAYGVAANDVIDISRRLGDLSLGNEQKFGRLAYAYGQVKAAGKLYGTELRQLTETGIPIIDALADHFEVATTDIRGMVEDGAISFNDFQQAINGLTDEGGQFFGLMEKGADTIPGIISNIGDAFTKFKESFKNTEAFEGVKTILKEILEFVDTTLPKISEKMDYFLTLIDQNRYLLYALAAVVTALLIPTFAGWITSTALGLVSIIKWYAPLLTSIKLVSAALSGNVSAAAGFIANAGKLSGVFTMLNNAAVVLKVSMMQIFSGSILQGLATLRTAFYSVGLAINSMLGPIGWAVIAVTAAIAIITPLIAKARADVERAWDKVADAAHENISRIEGDLDAWILASANLTGAELEYAKLRINYSNAVRNSVLADEAAIAAAKANSMWGVRLGFRQGPDMDAVQLAVDNAQRLLKEAEDSVNNFGNIGAANNAKKIYESFRNPTDDKKDGSSNSESDAEKENKELEKQKKLLEDITTASKKFDEARLSAMRKGLQGRKDEIAALQKELESNEDLSDIQKSRIESQIQALTLTEKEERMLKRLAASADEAFDLNNAKDWNEFMDALADSAEDLAGKYDEVTDAIADTRNELSKMAEEAGDAIEEAILKIGELQEELRDKLEDIDEEFTDKFGAAGGPIGGEAAVKLAEDLAKEYMKAKDAVADYEAEVAKGGSVSAAKGDAFVEAKQIIEKIEAIMNASSGGNGLGQALQDALQTAVQVEGLSPVEQVLAKAQAEKDAAQKLADDKKKEEEEAVAKEIKHQQTIIDMNTAFRDGELDAWIIQNEGVITARELLEAQELLNKETRLKDELDKNVQVQKDITAAIETQAGLRDTAMAKFHTDELGRLEAMKLKAVETINAIRAAMNASSSVTSGSVSSGPAMSSNYAGGFTARGSDTSIAGFVHKNEYVIPARLVRSLAPTGIIGMIERMRSGGGRGYMDGGMVGNSITKHYSPTLNIQANDRLDVVAIGQMLLSEIRNA